MIEVTHTQAEKNFLSVVEAVEESDSPVIINGGDTTPMVMMSLSDYNSLKETMYLMSSPINHQQLLESMGQIENGEIIKKTMQELRALEEK